MKALNLYFTFQGLLAWLVIFGLCVSLVNSDELFPGSLRLNKLTKPLRILGVFPYNGYSHFIMFEVNDDKLNSPLALNHSHVSNLCFSSSR